MIRCFRTFDAAGDRIRKRNYRGARFEDLRRRNSSLPRRTLAPMLFYKGVQASFVRADADDEIAFRVLRLENEIRDPAGFCREAPGAIPEMMFRTRRASSRNLSTCVAEAFFVDGI